jgi:hypothetical protein
LVPYPPWGRGSAKSVDVRGRGIRDGLRVRLLVIRRGGEDSGRFPPVPTHGEWAVEPELGSLGAHDGLPTIAPSGGDPATGEDVLADAVRVAGGCLGGRLLAAYAVGSLAHGGFSALVGDVDLALVLADPIQAADAATLLTVAADVPVAVSPRWAGSACSKTACVIRASRS